MEFTNNATNYAADSETIKPTYNVSFKSAVCCAILSAVDGAILSTN